ncbi:MAG: hypothetical protein D6732_18465, partial [Methanobacteriota archaeon]
MAIHQLIEIATGNVVHEHDDTNGPIPMFGGPWGNPDLYKWKPAPKSRQLEILKQQKEAEIKAAFNTALASGYTCTNGITMNARLEDVLKLKAGYDLAMKLNQTTMDIRDYNNVTHSAVPIADVDVMITELGTNYQTLWTKKNTLLDKM